MAPMRWQARDPLPLELAVLASVLLHAATLGAWQYRQQLARFSPLRPLARLVEALRPPPVRAPVRATDPGQTITFVAVPAVPEPPAVARVEPHIFVETDDRQPSAATVPETALYSDRATVAANPANPTGRTGDTPYLDGQDSRVLSSEDVPLLTTPVAPRATSGADRAALPSLTRPVRPGLELPATAAHPGAAGAAPSTATEPAPATETLGDRRPVTEPVGQPAQELPELGTQAAAAATATELAMAPVDSRPAPAPAAAAAAASPGGREIAAVKSRRVELGVDQEGVAAFNVAASPFGSYDKRLIRAVQSKWLGLVDKYDIAARTGTVRLSFQLYADGRISTLQRQENTAGEILALYCEKAILDNVPFEPLPEPLRVLRGDEPRAVNFTFYY